MTADCLIEAPGGNTVERREIRIKHDTLTMERDNAPGYCLYLKRGRRALHETVTLRILFG